MQRWGAAIRIAYALCLCGATVNHVRALAVRGWLPDGLPPATAIYWDSLTFLDPLAALLLLIRPRIGIALTAAIIVTDVAHNLWFTAVHGGAGPIFDKIAGNAFMLSQIGFLLFVAVTAPAAWKVAARDVRPSGDASH